MLAYLALWALLVMPWTMLSLKVSMPRCRLSCLTAIPGQLVNASDLRSLNISSVSTTAGGDIPP
jgi:hypothetical protein